MSVERPGTGRIEQPLLRIVDLHKRFGELEVLGGIDLAVLRGEKVSIIGPSGSGKTTLLRCINYLEKPSSGQIYIDGALIGEKLINGGSVHLSDRELAKERREIGFVFQRFNLFPHLTALGERHDRAAQGARAKRARRRTSRGRQHAARRSGLATRSTSIPSGCRAASSSASPSRASSPCSPSSCCSTRRPRRSIPSSSARCSR